jgi:hypothetical protein
MLRDLEGHSTCSTAMFSKLYAILFFSQITNLYITDKENGMTNYFQDWAYENRKPGFATGLNFILNFFQIRSIYLITAF